MNIHAKSIAALPATTQRLLRRGEQWLAQGEFGYAELTLNQALAQAPDHPEILRLLGAALHGLLRHAEAIDVFRRAETTWPDDALIQNHLGSALGDSSDYAGAVMHFRRAAELAPESVDIRLNLAKALEKSGDTEASLAAIEETLRLAPKHLEAQVLRADALRTLGRIDEATTAFRTIIQRDRDAIGAWVGLVNLKTFRPDENDLAELKRLQTTPSLAEHQRTAIGFAYGIALEANERYAEAYEAFTGAAATRRRRVTWNAKVAHGIVDRIASAFETAPADASDPSLGNEVIFVTSMPRSGSTLTEQVLAAHSQVEGAGEIGDLVRLLKAESMRRGSDFPAWVPAATPADWARLGHEYVAGTARLRTRKPRFTDKSILNWQLLGAARAMLPGARFVNVQRDALETCWSCFKHDFGIGQPFTYDFDDLAAYLHDYDRTLALWRRLYPADVYEQSYEELVRRPEEQIRALLEYCRLPFEPACLRPQDAQRSVRTASAAQVRGELRTDTARADRYGALLDPLRRAIAGAR